MKNFARRWKRGFWLLVIIALSQFVASIPWILIAWVVPQNLVPEGSVVFWVVGIVNLLLFPVVFYLCAGALGLELEEWQRQDKEDEDTAV